MAEHDQPYKRLFSHPEMVRDLLKGFVHQDWVAECDFSTLEKQNSSFVSEKWKRRESDVIWRIRLKNEWLYIYILLEFQSSPDDFMALRMLGYTSLFLQDLVEHQTLKASDKLPPVLPMVIYNGSKPWRGATDLADLMQEMPTSLKAFQPQMQYLLLDENRCSPEELAFPNLVTYLVKMEKSADEYQLPEFIEALARCLHDSGSQSGLSADFVRWLLRSLLPAKFPEADIPQVDKLNEVQTMLAENVTQWKDRWVHQGLEQGLEQGIGMGLAQGERKLFLRALTKRFGQLPAPIAEKIDNASSEQIEYWMDNLLTATALESVFE